MADFITSYFITKGNEGTYSDHPSDTGGETVFGVSRNNFPMWEGWAIVDKYATDLGRGSAAFKKALESDASLAELVRAWYKENFWDKFDLDKITNQGLANEVFDQAVNVGVGQCTRFIQRAINAFNKDFQFGADLLVDGAIGPNTRNKLVEVGNSDRYGDVFRKAIDALQGSFYIDLGLKKQDYRDFTLGWFRTRIGEAA